MISKLTRKGEVGVGTLLLMITILLVVLVFVGLYINAANKLETQGYKTADKTKSMISTRVLPSELQSLYQEDGLQHFTVHAQLTPGSEDFYLENLVITLTTEDEKTVLSFSGSEANLEHGPTGYYTLGIESYDVPSNLNDDMDQDGIGDNIFIDAGYAILNLSTGEQITLGNCGSPSLFNASVMDNDYVTRVSGVCQTGTVTEVTLTPKELGIGKYSVEFLIESEQHAPNKIVRGEIIKIYFESQNPVPTSSIGLLNFIPKTGSDSDLSFYVPDVISTGRVYLSHY